MEAKADPQIACLSEGAPSAAGRKQVFVNIWKRLIALVPKETRLFTKPSKSAVFGTILSLVNRLHI